jgi:hypothetical protein
MELILVFRVLLRRWWLVVIPLVVAAAIIIPDYLGNRDSAAGGFTTTIHYSAAQVLGAIPGRDGDFQDVWLASELAVNALTDWVRTSSFLILMDQAARERGASVNPSAIGIAADNRRSVGQLIISYPDAETLAILAEAAIGVLENQSQNYFPQLGGQPAQITVLDVPTVAPAPPPLTNQLAPFIRLAMALLAGVGLAFLAEYLDPTVRSREQVEALGLPVIATLPRD